MTRIVRAVVAAATAAMLVVLTGCVSTDTAVGTPTADAGSVWPTDVAAAGSDLAAPVADQTVFPAVAAPAEAPDTAGPAEAGAAVESMVWVTAGDHRVPGTLAVPAAPPAGTIPVVLLLHGDLSNRNENGYLAVTAVPAPYGAE